MSDVILQAKELSKHFALGEQQVDVLRDINLEIHRGEHVAIVGSSGSGKSTLLHCLGGLDAPSAGSVSLLMLGGRTGLLTILLHILRQTLYLLLLLRVESQEQTLLTGIRHTDGVITALRVI